MCASTLCPLSSSTLNCVLGNASVTVPSTSITSSLAKDLLCCELQDGWPGPNDYVTTHTAFLLPPVHRKDPRAILGDGDGVLVVGGQRVIGGVDGPPVPFTHADIVVAQRDHGLYREGHPGQEARARPQPPVVRYLRLLVHLAPDAVRDQIPNHAVPPRFGQSLYRVPDIPEPLANPDLLRRRQKTLPRGIQEPFGLLGHFADRHCRGAVGHESFVAHADVQGYYVPRLQSVGARNAVHDHGVRRRADGGWKALVALELWGSASGAYEFLGHPVEVPGGDPATNVLSEHFEAGGSDLAAFAHRLQFACALADDQEMARNPSPRPGARPPSPGRYLARRPR